jgi:hypothetical protein
MQWQQDQATIETQGPEVPFHFPAAQCISPMTAAQDGIAYAPPFTVPNQMIIPNPFYQQTYIYLSHTCGYELLMS